MAQFDLDRNDAGAASGAGQRDAALPDLVAAQAALQRFTLMSDSVPVLMAYYRRDGLVCDYANQPYTRTFGAGAASVVGRGLVEIIGAEAMQRIQPHIDLVFATHQTVTYQRSVVADGAPPRWIEVSLVPHAEADGSTLAGAFVLISDITRFHEAEQALRDSEERLRKFMDASVEGIAFHRDGIITDVNAPIAALLGYAREQMLGRHVMDFVAPEHHARAEQGRLNPSELPYESALLDHQGQPLPVELFARELQRDGEPLRMVVVRDIRDRQAARARMQHLAEHDALTGLRNRGAFMAALSAAIERHPADAPPMALLFVDLDHFKQVNDAHGHLAGDALLCAAAGRLLGGLRSGAVVGRFGGDEFVILLPAVADRDEARQAGARLLTAMAEPVRWNGHPMSVTPTIGVALFPDDGHSADALLRHADTALYAGKAAGRAVVTMFEPAMARAAETGQQQQDRVAAGLAGGEFVLMLQPRLALATGPMKSAGAAPASGPGSGAGLAGLQASLRWRDADRGWLSPTDFAAASQRPGQPLLLDWALQEALALTLRWQAQGLAMPLSLNLAGLVPRVGSLAAAVGRVLARQAGAPGLLALELPEQLLVDDRHATRRNIEQLAQLGLPVWLDDFGAGGAALADLRHLPLAGLLLTPALVGGLPDDRGALAVTRAIVTLADGLGLPVCAPGVAGGAQVDALRAIGCPLLQGPWYQPPMRAAEAGAWLAAHAGQALRPWRV